MFPLNTYFYVKAKLSENPKKFIAQLFDNRDMSKIDIYDLAQVTEKDALAAWERDRAAPALNAVLLLGLIAKGKQAQALEQLSKGPCDLTVADEVTGGTVLTAAITKARLTPSALVQLRPFLSLI